MPILSQGNIFQSIQKQKPVFAIIFGRSFGFNLMAATYSAFREGVQGLPLDPFAEAGGEPFRSQFNKAYLWFIYEGAERAMTDEALTSALDEALSHALKNNATTIITNGIKPVDDGDVAKKSRAKFLIDYATAKEAAKGISIELISLNDTFKGGGDGGAIA